ncbi:MAG: hypothetical protein PHR82_07315 [Endomicrobiaceae bacterium]|nr:hypothetical protein [Endomicrobiaceae bacterium]
MENLSKFKVIVAYFISFVILSSSYVPAVGMYEMFSDDVGQVYESTKISDYYNLIALLPIKLVNKFVSNTIDIKNNIVNKTASDKQNNKNKKSHNNNFDIAFVNNTINENAGNLGESAGKFLSAPVRFDFDATVDRISINIIFFVVILFFCFRLLARGDTEDYIINKNRNGFRLG